MVIGCDETEPLTSPGVVQQPQSTTFTVLPSEVELAVGETAQLQANVGGVSGIVLPGLTWTSSDPDIAIVTPFGLVAARAEGIAIITAQSGSMSAGARVVVSGKVRTY
jgi:uncharacterized protein YjdB